MYLVFGDSDFTARLAPALMGTLMVPLPALLRSQIGRVGAFAAAAALAFGPTFLYYSRFAREDIYFACITLALLAVTFRFLDRPRAPPAGADRRAARAELRHEGDDVHLRVRVRDVLDRRADRAGARGADSARRRSCAPW